MAIKISDPGAALGQIEIWLNNFDSYIKVMRLVARSLGADDGDTEDALNVIADDFAQVSKEIECGFNFLNAHFRTGLAKAPSAPSPVMALFREWEAAYAYAGEGGLSDEEVGLRCDKFREIGRKLLQMPVTDGDDFAAKFLVHTQYGECDISAHDGDCFDLFADAKALTRKPSQ